MRRIRNRSAGIGATGLNWLFPMALFACGCSTRYSAHDLGAPDLGADNGDATDGGASQGGANDASVVADLSLALPAAPLGSESVLYAPSDIGNEQLAYNRLIRLAHSSDANGTLLGVFEHSLTNQMPSPIVVRKSSDDGVTWSTLANVFDGETGSGHPSATMYQPFLFELPKAMGGYPEGTLLLTANVLPLTGDATHFQLWRSTDHGATWKYVGLYQVGGKGGVGIWEPFLDIDGDGNLICYFSDERQSAEHSQVLDHIISTDGGDTWSANPDGSTRVAPGLVGDVVSSNRNDRPGMATVAKLPDGTRFMSYEVCGTTRGACEVHVKASIDGGHTWGTGPADLGTFVQTTDGRYLGSSPYIAFSPFGGAHGQLLLSAMRTRLVADDTFAPEDYQSVFINTDGGQGSWSWMPAPAFVAHAAGQGSCYTNYSPNLLPSLNSFGIRYTAPSMDATHPCAERTAIANAGVLPYESPFALGTDAGWKSYGGCWSVTNGLYGDNCGQTNGNKAIAGSTGWTDYTMTADVRLDAAGSNAGLLIRVSNPAVGVDAHHGYYVGLGNGVFLGREDYNWTSLASATATVNVGSWYHVEVRAKECTFAVSMKAAGTNDPLAAFTYTDGGCANLAGAVGVRDFGGGASFRDVRVTGM